MNKQNGFTLIELMIVIAIIGILMGTTFKLMGVAVDAKARAVTVARMERLQNALSGYYATYGMYPAVPFYGDPNPFSTEPGKAEDTGQLIGNIKDRCQAAARAQPVGFEYPTPVWMDDKIPILFYPNNVISVNTAVGSLSPTDSDWDKYKGFKFGLMSFLLPRVQIVGHPNDGDRAPLRDVYQRAQWMDNNLSSRVPGNNNADITLLMQNLEKQRVIENEACIRWLPCFEGILRSFLNKVTLRDANNKIIAEVEINGDEAGGHRLAARQMQGGPKVALAFITITDGWGREFFYYSAPPYQSFRVWSAGADGLTYPPWVPSNHREYTSDATKWKKDDIVGGKMQM
jgi:prepilin-type N-terminal cleavage/methylation domain-containing protein